MSYNPTRMERVVLYLGDRSHRWVPGYELTTPEIGGSEGLRRVREARQAGWDIDARPMADSDAWEYRLVIE